MELEIDKSSLHEFNRTEGSSLVMLPPGQPGKEVAVLFVGCSLKQHLTTISPPPTSYNPQVWHIHQRGKSFTLILQLSSSSIFSSFKSRWTTPF